MTHARKDETNEAAAGAPGTVSCGSELHQAAGVPAELVADLLKLNLVRPGDDGRFTPDDVERVRIAETLVQQGVALGDLAKAVEAGFLSLDWIRAWSPTCSMERTNADLYAEFGIDPRFVERVYATWGLSRPAPGAQAREDDMRILDVLARFHRELGSDEERVFAATRFFGENLRRIGESAVRWFRTSVFDELRQGGASRVEAMAAASRLRARLTPLATELVERLFARFLWIYNTQARVQLLEEGLEAFGIVPPRTANDPCVAFLDLSGFTRMTEETGDENAARLASNLAEFVAEAAASHSGTLVKYLGDGVMFHFEDSRGAIDCGVSAVTRAPQSGLPPARMGIHSGPVVFRDGDYFGRTVNVAARITDYARPGEVLVSEAALSRAQLDRSLFRRIGPVLLRGVSEPIALFAASGT